MTVEIGAARDTALETSEDRGQLVTSHSRHENVVTSGGCRGK